MSLSSAACDAQPPYFTRALKKLVDQGVPHVKGEQQYMLMYKGKTELTVLLVQIRNGKQPLGAQISLCKTPIAYYSLTIFLQKC